MRFSAGRVATAAVVLLAAVACSGQGSSSERPASGSPSADATPTPAPAGPRAGDVRWLSRAYGEPVEAVAAIGDGHVVMTSAATVRLDAAGEEEWVVREPASRRGYPQAFAAGDMVVRYSIPEDTDRGAGRSPHVRVLDGRTGRLRWQRDVGEVVVTPSSVFASACGGRGDGASDGCAVMALDPATGRERWRTPASVDALRVVGATVQITSFPYGTDRTADPYGERTLVRVLDAETGERLGPDQLGNFFEAAGRLLVEESVAGSVGRACQAVLVARRLDGREVWSRSFDWTLPREATGPDADCALALDVTPLGRGRIEVVAGDRVGLLLDARTGRTLWDHGGRRRVLASFAGVDVVTDSAFRRFQGLDARTHRRRWQATGTPSLTLQDVEPAGYLALTQSEGDAELLELRSVRSGEVSLRTPGSLVGSGRDWVATVIKSPRGDRVSLVHWPH
ncbi:PQQ-binding-like beta-propeller repeat protein [Nocardioides lijunqiniae]|uniref:outer membrane protein assembly factor BamB family protein n=1 Tax=Nocardioides lijunqiniae TaxID=2760832 RepID=UPI0018788FE2|nr:PQQ-binding-like beta-propeller repeat protein [Nocardioides lijunqiniae]